MPEVGFDCRSQAGDISPDSVFFTLGSNFSSLFSSTSGSGERCSFASNAEVSQHLAGHDLRHASSGPDSDLRMLNIDKNGRLWRKVGKAEVQRDDSGTETDDCNLIFNSGRNSFSQALKECQDHRLRSEGFRLKEDRSSFQMTRVTYSPRLGTNKRELITMAGQTSNLHSPRALNYRHSSVDIQKGWSSERIPLHGNITRRINVASGRALPSKWEDAERWIFSPVSSDGSMRTTSHQQPLRKPKSKSGPLGPPGTAYYSLFSPAIPMFDGGKARNLMAGSPFSSGVTSTGGFSARSTRDGSVNFPARMEPFMARSISIHGCTEMPGPFLLPGTLDKNLARDKEEEIDVYRPALRKDVSTQMSPERDNHTSSNWELILPSAPSAVSIHEFNDLPLARSKVRDVLVDDHLTMARRSWKQREPFPEKRSLNLDNWNKKNVEDDPSYSWNVSETAKNISIMKREEAKITAWENLQKAKAEAEIRQLEMKLEKKRSSSMDKILNKLKSAQKKAHSMRSNVSTNHVHHQVTNTSDKNISFRKARKINSFSGCFTCHAH